MHTNIEQVVGVPIGRAQIYETPQVVVAALEMLRAVLAQKEGRVFTAAWTRCRWHIADFRTGGECKQQDVRCSIGIVTGREHLDVHANIFMYGDGQGHWLHGNVELMVAMSDRSETYEVEMVGGQYDARPATS